MKKALIATFVFLLGCAPAICQQQLNAASKEDIQDGHPQQGVGKTKSYGCYYSNARLLYTATLVKNPKAEVAEAAE